MIFNSDELIVMTAALLMAANAHDRQSREKIIDKVGARKDAHFAMECSRIAGSLKKGTLGYSDHERKIIVAALQWTAMTHEKIAQYLRQTFRLAESAKAAAAAGECARIADKLKKAG